MQPTTALRKIAGLRKRIKGIQGGQGAGKTYAILILLINHASSCANKEIFVASEELSKMRITVIKDFLNIMKAFGIFSKDCFVDGTLYRFPNGSFIKFIGLDKEDIGKGLRCDVMFVNEANKIKFDTYRELTSRAKQIFIDFNPNKKFWFHTEVMIRNDCDFIKLTYLDNEYLSREELNEILRYKQRGYAPNETGGYAVNEKGELVVLNQYWANMWRVYGLGEVGQVEGRIYTWQPIAYEDYLKINKTVYYGSDWGKVDPWAVVEIKYSDGNLYVHEKNYSSENEIERTLTSAEAHQIKGSTYEVGGIMVEGLIGWMFRKMNIDQSAMVICDSNRPAKILSLRNAGWEYAVGVGGKTKIIERVGLLAGLNIYYTDCSTNIEAEQENYCYSKDKFGVVQEEPIEQDNHSIDAIVYVVQKLFAEGVIKHL
jgi:phage terminase large subunit